MDEELRAIISRHSLTTISLMFNTESRAKPFAVFLHPVKIQGRCAIGHGATFAAALDEAERELGALRRIAA